MLFKKKAWAMLISPPSWQDKYFLEFTQNQIFMTYEENKHFYGIIHVNLKLMSNISKINYSKIACFSVLTIREIESDKVRCSLRLD